MRGLLPLAEEVPLKADVSGKVHPSNLESESIHLRDVPSLDIIMPLVQSCLTETVYTKIRFQVAAHSWVVYVSEILERS